MSDADSRENHAAFDPEMTAALARRAREGCVSSFGELYERVAPALFIWSSLRMRYEHSKHFDAEDVVQEVWMRALRKVDSFDPATGSFRAWIFGFGKLVQREVWRLGQRLDEAGLVGCEKPKVFGGQDDYPEEVTAVSARLAREEWIGKLTERVRRLGVEDREIFIYCGLEQKPASRVAELLGISRDKVLKRWQRLREQLVAENLPVRLLDVA